MKYAIEILEKDRRLLLKALDGWSPEFYQEAYKDRARKLKEIDEAIDLLKQ